MLKIYCNIQTFLYTSSLLLVINAYTQGNAWWSTQPVTLCFVEAKLHIQMYKLKVNT